MPAVPKHKRSSHRQGKIRKSYALKSVKLVKCSSCGAPKRPHHLCSQCGN